MHATAPAPSPTQRRVLVALKRLGEATADELAAALEISSSAVRQHMGALRSAGLVAAHKDRGQPGRPADRYHATELAETLFVTSGTDLAIEILRDVEDEDPAIVDRIFDRRRRRLVEDASASATGRSIEDQVHFATRLLDNQGFLADLERVDDDRYHLHLHSCAIWPVASRYRQACTTELEFLRALIPDGTVERVTHKTSGAHTCTYVISTAPTE